MHPRSHTLARTHAQTLSHSLFSLSLSLFQTTKPIISESNSGVMFWYQLITHNAPNVGKILNYFFIWIQFLTNFQSSVLLCGRILLSLPTKLIKYFTYGTKGIRNRLISREYLRHHCFSVIIVGLRLYWLWALQVPMKQNMFKSGTRTATYSMIDPWSDLSARKRKVEDRQIHHSQPNLTFSRKLKVFAFVISDAYLDEFISFNFLLHANVIYYFTLKALKLVLIIKHSISLRTWCHLEFRPPKLALWPSKLATAVILR